MSYWILERFIEFKTSDSRWDPVVVYATRADAERAQRCLPVGGSAAGGRVREFRVRELVD
jgi:hypothetical protein